MSNDRSITSVLTKPIIRFTPGTPEMIDPSVSAAIITSDSAQRIVSSYPPVVSSVTPIIVGGGDRLEMDSNHLRGGNQLGGVVVIGGAQLVTYLG